MSSEDLYIITAILGIAFLSLAVRSLLGYSRKLLGDGETTTSEVALHSTAAHIPSSSPGHKPAQDINITFYESDKQFPWDSDMECLLDFIEAKGIEVECLCGAGECGSCRTRLIEGEVEYLLEPKVAPGEGYCLLCVTAPKTDLVLAR